MSSVGLYALTNTQPWTENAKCRQSGPDDLTWFPDKFSRGLDAKRICAGCDVRTKCLEYAMNIGERHGVWGGLNASERDDLRRRASSGRHGRHPVNCQCGAHGRSA